MRPSAMMMDQMAELSLAADRIQDGERRLNLYHTRFEHVVKVWTNDDHDYSPSWGIPKRDLPIVWRFQLERNAIAFEREARSIGFQVDRVHEGI